jgi:glyoxylase-like metal-dependent hydrolase (beta-lactamase superfamily II)
MSLTRRDLFASAALGVAGVGLAAAGLSPALANAPMGGAQNAGFYRAKLGDAEIIALNDGAVGRPLQDGFVRNVPLDQLKAFLGENFLPQDEVRLSFNQLVVNTAERTVLIDTGTGGAFGPTTGRLRDNLAAAGIMPEQIDAVLISHFHPDHIGGLAARDGAPAFPNARILIAEAEAAFWLDSARMDAAPEAMRGVFQGAMGIFEALGDRVERFAAGAEVLPGLTALEASGHTPGHTVFQIASGGGSMLLMADTTNDPRIFARNPGWRIQFDMDADKAETTRRALLDRAAAEKSLLFFYHAPFPALGYVAKAGEGYRYEPIGWNPVL